MIKASSFLVQILAYKIYSMSSELISQMQRANLRLSFKIRLIFSGYLFLVTHSMSPPTLQNLPSIRLIP